MPAYNPPPQVLFSPVTNYYQGKAIRQGLEEQKTDIALKEKTLGQADEKLALAKRRAALAEKEIEQRNKAYDLNREKFEHEVGREAAAKAAFDVYSITRDINEEFERGGKTPEAQEASLGLAAERFAEYAESLPDGESKAKLLEMLEGGVTAEEYQAILPVAERNARYYGFLKEPEDTVLPDGSMLIRDGVPIVENPRDFAPDKTDKPTFDPPNAAEIDAALKIVKRELDLDSRYHTDAAMWLANEVRNIQERSEESYDVAVAMALAKMKSKLGEEPDLLSGRDDTLTYSTETLGANEYLVRGEVWVKESNGRIHRKNP